MATGNTSLLGLALPVEGELTGTWGDVVNDSITSLVDSAVAGTTTLSADADVTLTDTVLAANQARQAIIRWTASNGATTRNITAPAQSKPYIVINAGTGSIVLRGAGPTTGITIIAGERCVAAWSGSDFVKVATSTALPGDVVGPASATNNNLAAFDGTTGKLIKQAATVTVAQGGTGATTAPDARTNFGATTLGSNLFTVTNPSAVTFPRFNADNTVSSLNAADFRTAIGAGSGTGTVTSVGGTGTVNGITLTGTVTSSGNLTLGGALSGVNLTTQVTGTLPIANGGTGETTRQAAMDTLAGAVTSGQYLRGNGADVVMSTIQAADVPTLNQNTTGTASNVTGTVAVANGGTGRTSLTANNVLLGNGTSAANFVAPGSTGNVLTSNGSTWVSQAAGGGGPLVLVSSFTTSLATTITVDSSIITSAYDNYLVTFDGTTPNSSGVYANINYELNNGSTWIQSGYNLWNNLGTVGSATNQTEVRINGSSGTQPYLDPNYPIYFEVTLLRVNNTGTMRLCRHSGSFSTGQNFPVNFIGAANAADIGSSNFVRGIRFYNGQSVGMTGRVRVYGFRNS